MNNHDELAWKIMIRNPTIPEEDRMNALESALCTENWWNNLPKEDIKCVLGNLAIDILNNEVNKNIERLPRIIFASGVENE